MEHGISNCVEAQHMNFLVLLVYSTGKIIMDFLFLNNFIKKFWNFLFFL